MILEVKIIPVFRRKKTWFHLFVTRRPVCLLSSTTHAVLKAFCLLVIEHSEKTENVLNNEKCFYFTFEAIRHILPFLIQWYKESIRYTLLLKTLENLQYIEKYI
jgi:hypothetical protein